MKNNMTNQVGSVNQSQTKDMHKDTQVTTSLEGTAKKFLSVASINKLVILLVFLASVIISTSLVAIVIPMSNCEKVSVKLKAGEFQYQLIKIGNCCTQFTDQQ